MMKVIIPSNFGNRNSELQNRFNIYFEQKPSSFIRRVYLNVVGELNLRGFHFIGDWDSEEECLSFYEGIFYYRIANIMDKLSYLNIVQFDNLGKNDELITSAPFSVDFKSIFNKTGNESGSKVLVRDIDFGKNINETKAFEHQNGTQTEIAPVNAIVGDINTPNGKSESDGMSNETVSVSHSGKDKITDNDSYNSTSGFDTKSVSLDDKIKGFEYLEALNNVVFQVFYKEISQYIDELNTLY